jgi:hypothetical protein
MVLDIVANVFLSFLDLLKGSLLIAVIVFFFVLIARVLSKKLTERFKFSWIKSSIASTYAVLFVVLLVLYFFPMTVGFSEEDLGVVPKELQWNAFDFFYLIGGGLLRVALLSALFSVFLLPLEFVGVFLLEKVKEKWGFPELVNVFASTFGATLLGLFIILFVFPWMLTSIIYLIYFA